MNQLVANARKSSTYFLRALDDVITVVLEHLALRGQLCNLRVLGYSYCHSCTDYQALVPRSQPQSNGYDSIPVCAFCIEFLQSQWPPSPCKPPCCSTFCLLVTASGRVQLKQLTLAKLKKYLNAYGIKHDRAVEKDDLVNAALEARNPNGCLPAANEVRSQT